MKPLHIIKKEGDTEFHLLTNATPLMTKPSYEELEAIIDRCHLALGEDPNSDDATLPEAIAAHLDGEKEALKRWQTVETSLALVRGLLQRIVRALKYYDNHQTSEAMALLRDTIMASELDAATSGAESADIGKLDAVDKSDDDLWMGAICAECENGDRPYQLHGERIHD